MSELESGRTRNSNRTRGGKKQTPAVRAAFATHDVVSGSAGRGARSGGEWVRSISGYFKRICKVVSGVVIVLISPFLFMHFYQNILECMLVVHGVLETDSTANYWSSMQNLLAVPAYLGALYVYYKSKTREARDREEALFAGIEDRYSDFIGVCLQNPDEKMLNYAEPEKHSITLDENDEQKLSAEVLEARAALRAKDRILGDLLLSLFQSAYFVYYCRDEHLTEIREQRDGWDKTIAEHLKNRHFLAYYCEAGYLYGEEFNAYLRDIFIERVEGGERLSGWLDKLTDEIMGVVGRRNSNAHTPDGAGSRS